ncbi:MAG TPA: glycosyl hydrolase family 8, partial [Acidimicrobiales bacterium]|nr:glycosyl hydrolase family 8 [Acidimicrobiales bacterium]
MADHATGPRRAGRLIRASLAAASLVVVGSVLLASCSSPSTTSATTTTTDPPAMHLAATFLDNYMDSDGRIVRHDQGGDTVSEGQAYGLLLAVAAHDAARFASIWSWTKENLQEPSGLFAYDWSNGAIVGTGAATDADLNTAWALVLGAKTFHDPAYEKDGLAVASAVLANETVVSAGRLELVAGPWARSAPYAVDPSYFSPEAMAALASASGNPSWTQLETNSQQLVAALQGGDSMHYLPPDWALLSASGGISASSPPSGGKPPSYGLDAERVPI